MSTWPKVIGIRADAVAAFEALNAALKRTEAPCVGRGEWTSEDASDRDWAAAQCVGCLAIHRCGQFAEANLERHGVWAGVDRTSRTSPSRRTA